MNITFKKSIIILAAVVFIGGFARIYKLGNQSFVADEFLGVNIGYGYHETGQWQFWDFNDQQLTDEKYTRANIYYWQIGKIYDLLGVSEFSSRLVSVAWGIIGILLAFFVSYRLFRNYWVSLLSSALLAASISALTFDRKLRMYSMFAPVYLALSYLLYKFIETQPKKGFRSINAFSKKTGLNWNYFLPLLFVSFVSFNTHLLTVNIIPTAAAYFIIMAFYSHKITSSWKNKYTFFSLLAIFGFFILLYIPQLKSTLDFSSFGWSYLQEITLNYSYGPLAAIVFIFGAYYLIKRHKKTGLWLVLAFIVPLLSAIFAWNRNVGPQYIYFTEIFKAIIMAAGIFFISKYFIDHSNWQRKSIAFIVAISLFLLLLINIPFFFSDKGFYQDIRKWSYPNYRNVFGYYLKNRKPEDLLITRKLNYYYIQGSKSNTLVYNEENRLTVEKIMKAQEQYNRIWFIVGNDNFIKGSAMDYIEKTFHSIKTKYTNDTVSIWLWEKG